LQRIHLDPELLVFEVLVDHSVLIVESHYFEKEFFSDNSWVLNSIDSELDSCILFCSFTSKDGLSALDVDVRSAFSLIGAANQTFLIRQVGVSNLFDYETVFLHQGFTLENGAVVEIIGHNDPEEAVERNGVLHLEVEGICLLCKTGDVAFSHHFRHLCNCPALGSQQ
jgi:hypothetical protein